MPRVTRAEIARQLNVSPSTVTQWIKRYPHLDSADKTVDVDDFMKHRRQVLQPGRSAGGKKRGDAAKRAKGQKVASDPPAGLDSYESREAAILRRERAKADEAELDLAERLGRTIRADLAQAAVADATLKLRQELFRGARDHAEELSLISDPREMERALEAMLRDILETAADSLAAAVSDG